MSLKDKVKLNEYEEIIATELILPEDIPSSFSDIGGMDEIINGIKQTVLVPLQFSLYFTSHNPLLSPPRGVLLYGPPGCGKTMLAKAIARESKASFINLKLSTLTEKWFGESQKLVKAVFTLARKIEPTIIFIDEIDSFLRSRQSNDHEVTAMMKAEFMSLWDGLTTDADSRTVVLGATNRPLDIDEAILRRMPKKFHVPLPSVQQRLNILKLTLKGSKVAPDFNYEELSQLTDGYSGSDLKELCRTVAMIPIQEFISTRLNGDLSKLESFPKESVDLRPICLSDFKMQNGKKQELPSEDALD